MKIDLNSKTAFITGGNGGIGKAICKALRECGAEVISPSSAQLDLRSQDAINDFSASQKISPDIVIHCAGVNDLAGIEEVTPGVMQKAFNVNLFSFISLLNKFIPDMKRRNFGRIIGITSIYGIVSRERRIPYSSSKHAMNGLIKSLAIETAKDNILINGVAPGYVMTEMTRKNLSVSEIEAIKQQLPTGKFQEAEDIANLCCFLCSDLNQSITGQIIAVDGGFTCK